MTIDEAIRILKLSIRNSREHIRFCYDEKGITALDMAIQALEQINKITDLLDGTIDHFDRDDAIDLLYEIKGVIK